VGGYKKVDIARAATAVESKRVEDEEFKNTSLQFLLAGVRDLPIQWAEKGLGAFL
jgi:hypothetical protein